MVVIDDPKQCGHGLELVVRRFALEQLNDGASQAPNIRCCGWTSQFNNLGGHPVRGSHNAGLAEVRCFGSDTKISQLNQSLLGRQNVCALDIPVYDTLLVQIQQP